MRCQVLSLAWLLATACNQILDLPEVHPDRAPRVAQVKIDGHGDSTQVRQGLGTITLVVTGDHLDALGEARLGSWPASMVDELPQSVRLTVDVPHGAPPGPLELVLTSAAGESSAPGAVTITPITAAPAGDDATGAGTSDRPFRSLRHASSVATSGDTVFLKDGSYSVASGEVWPEHPQDPAAPAAPSIPAGITIEGESMTGTVLEGSGDPAVLDSGLIVAGKATIKKLTLVELSRAILIAGGTVELESIAVLQSHQQALVVLGTAEVDVRDSLFAGGTDRGVLVRDQAKVRLERTEVKLFLQEGVRIRNEATVTMTDVDVHNNGDGITNPEVGYDEESRECGVVVYGQPTVIIDSSRIHDNELIGIRVMDARRLELIDTEVFGNGRLEKHFDSYGLVATWADVVIQGGKFYENKGNAIELNSMDSVSVSDALLMNNDGAGITLVNVVATKVRGTTIINKKNTCCGMFLVGTGNAVIDFGTADDPGRNQTFGEAFVAIRDSREAGAHPATFVGTKVNGKTLPAGAVTGPVEVLDDYYIEHSGSWLEF